MFKSHCCWGCDSCRNWCCNDDKNTSGNDDKKTSGNEKHKQSCDGDYTTNQYDEENEQSYDYDEENDEANDRHEGVLPSRPSTQRLVPAGHKELPT